MDQAVRRGHRRISPLRPRLRRRNARSCPILDGMELCAESGMGERAIPKARLRPGNRRIADCRCTARSQEVVWPARNPLIVLREKEADHSPEVTEIRERA